MRRYYASLEAALRAAYPEYPWDSPRFSENERLSRNFWRNKATQRQFLDGLAKKLNIPEVREKEKQSETEKGTKEKEKEQERETRKTKGMRSHMKMTYKCSGPDGMM